MEKIRALQGEFLNLDKLWKLTTCEDAFVRRALYRLLIVALAKQKNSLNPSIISANVLTSGLHTKQTGSAFDFARAITILSQELPDVWTLHYTGTGKKSAQSRLNHFFRRGSQGGPPDFWSTVSSLLSSLPHSILTSTNEDEGNSKAENRVLYSTVLPALREGINSKGEGRMNRGSAWNTYLDAFELVQASLPESVDRPLFYEESLVPILTQYIRPLPDQSSWAVSGPQHKSIVLRTCNLTLQESPKLFEKEWQALSTKIVEDFKTSLPEQSKEYAKSQDSISAMTDRWYQLQSFLVSGQSGSALTAIFERSVPDEITSALAVIKSRNGKPYGTAAAVNIAVQSLPDVVLSKTAMRETLVDFANTVIPDLLISPSAKYLVQLLGLLEDKADVSQAYEKCMRTLAEVPDSEPKSSTLQIFTSSPLLAHNSFLSTIVMGSLQKALRDDNELSWKLAMAAISNSAAPKRLTDDLLLRMIGSLSIHTTSSAGLHGLEMAIKQRESIVKDFVLSTKGSSLISALLSLSESDEETVSQKARGLSGLIERAISISSNPDQATKPMLETINSSLDAAEADSLRYVTSSLAFAQSTDQRIG